MIDLEREQPITLAEAPKLIPAINAVSGMEARKPLHPRTVYNWSSKGKRGIVLETVPVGGILVTTKEAIQRFFDRLSQARAQRCIDRRIERDRFAEAINIASGRRSHRCRTKAHEETRARLARKHGI